MIRQGKRSCQRKRLGILGKRARFCKRVDTPTRSIGADGMTACWPAGQSQPRKDGPNATPNHMEIAGLFWHFVDLVWILVFTFMYLI